MRNSQNGTILELLSNNSLNDGIILYINVGCGLVDENYFALFKEGSAYA
jgi:hypothetical protein